MRNRQTSTSIKLILEQGLPSQNFLQKAWASEPLTNVLTGTNISFALPGPDTDISLIAKNGEEIVGQCSANRVVKYWNHIENISTSQQNLSTQAFLAIHKKAVADEKKYLREIHQPEELSFHSAGIAVLPECRGNNIGQIMREEQIETCKQHRATTLFCETTNLFSAATVAKLDFVKVAAYPYKDLAVELENPDLSRLDDSFSVWCRRI